MIRQTHGFHANHLIIMPNQQVCQHDLIGTNLSKLTWLRKMLLHGL